METPDSRVLVFPRFPIHEYHFQPSQNTREIKIVAGSVENSSFIRTTLILLSKPQSGSCDEEGNCNCSQTELDLSESLKNLLGGTDVVAFVKSTYKDFKAEVNSWSLTQSVKELAPSRCALGNE